MADFTLNGPGAVNNPWTPANIIIPVGSLQSDATGWRPTGFVYTVAAHNATYGSIITATATIAVPSTADQVYLGAIARTGANAGCMIGTRWDFNTDAVTLTSLANGTNSSISTNTTVPTLNIGDVLLCTVSISGGTATITASINGTPLTFSANTTTTFATEPSLAAGFVMDPQDVNGTKLSQFTGTGVQASNAATIAWLR